ncbi:hypothetical protein L218DRAFT_358983 [Marasmius fiardii PR-910]|nr:hypothetical protein L218DRAFT_358983 [Marasmius fiardii PR-910]
MVVMFYARWLSRCLNSTYDVRFDSDINLSASCIKVLSLVNDFRINSRIQVKCYFCWSVIISGLPRSLVTLGGGSDDMPLLLNYFLVTSTTSSSSPNPTSSLPSPIPAQDTSSKAAIIGGVVAGIVGLITISILVVLWLKEHRKNEPVSDEQIDLFFIAPMGERGFDPQSLISHTRHENGRRAKSHLTQGQPTSEEAETAAGLRRAHSGNRRLLQWRDRESETASKRLPPPHQAQGSAPIVHTDSGWRMRGERTSSERHKMSERPQGYTET